MEYNSENLISRSEFVQRKINNGVLKNETIYFEKGLYLIDRPIQLPSNTTIVCEDETVFIAKFNTLGRGGSPTTIFTNKDHNSGNQNISIINAIFNGNGNGSKLQIGNQFKFANTLKFVKVKGLRIEDCTIINHISDIPKDYINHFEDARNCVTANFEKCSKVKLINSNLINNKNEGPWFWRCKDVLIDKMYSITVSGLSTHLSFWYCNKVKLLNSKFLIENGGGSCFNIESSNVIINNNYIEGGRGIDVSNEGEFEIFRAKNVTISNNELKKVKYYGIIRNRTENILDGFNVHNNHVVIDARKFNFNVDKIFGIKTDDTFNSVISNNTIEFLRSEKDGFNCIAFGSFGFDEKNTLIKNNTIKNTDILFMGSCYVGNKHKIKLDNNKVKFWVDNSLYRKEFGNIHLYNLKNSKTNKELNGFTIANNTLKKSNGRFIKFDNEVELTLKNVNFMNNNIKVRNNSLIHPDDIIQVKGVYSIYSENIIIKNNKLPSKLKKSNFDKNIKNIILQ